MSIFDADTYLEELFAEQPTEYTAALLPESEYEGVVKSVAIKPPKDESGSPMLMIRWLPILPPHVAAQLKIDPEKVFTIQQKTIFLDVETDPDTGRPKLMEGTNLNLALGRVREATGQNIEGRWPLKSLIGCRAKIRVTQIPAYNDATRKLNEVSSVAKL